MKLWHAGFKVDDLEKAIKVWEKLDFKVKQKFEKGEPSALAALLEDDRGVGVELWQFNEESPLNEFIGRHIAYKCDDAQATAELLKQHGYKEVIPFTKGVMVNYIFLQDEFGTNIELAEVKEGKWSND
jgi:catechol 2,3-dioxygenase-like lactoylglutathione lyase family enzyme